MVLNLNILVQELLTVPTNRWKCEEPHIIEDKGLTENNIHTTYYTLDYGVYFLQLESTIGGVSSGSINLNVFNKYNQKKEQIASKTATNKEICTRAQIEVSPLAELYDQINKFYSN